MENPYEPSDAGLVATARGGPHPQPAPSAPAKFRPLLGILAGWVVFLFMAFGLNLVIGVAVRVFEAYSGLELAEAHPASLRVLVPSAVAGLAAGYATGRVAQQREILVALIGVLSAFSLPYLGLLAGSDFVLDRPVFGWLDEGVGFVLGGAIARRRRLRAVDGAIPRFPKT